MGTKKINSLRETQISKFAEYREKWIKIVLNTEPTDIPAAEVAVRQCYELAGLTAPVSIICFDSPLSAANIINKENNDVYKIINHVFNNIRDQVIAKVKAKVGDQVWDQVVGKVWVQVLDAVQDRVLIPVWDQVCNQVRVQVLNSVRDREQDQDQDQVRDKVWTRVRYCGANITDAGLLSLHDYFREVCGLVKETEKLTGLIALLKCCGWWTPCKNVAIIQHRPCFIALDDEKRLHCDDGMAIKYRDGFGVWAIHGVRLNEQIIMKPEEQTVKQIKDEPSAEIKRIRIERFGWNRYLTAINAKVIDSRYNDIENTYETLVRTPDGMAILLPTCKTGRLFSLEVPSDVLTCEQAQNWLHGGSQLDTIVGKTRVIGRS